MSEIIRYNESERLALHSWLRNIQKLQEGSTGMDKTVEFTPYNVLIKMVVAEIFFSARQIDNTGLHSHPILLYPTSQLHYKLQSDTNVFVAPVVKSTLVYGSMRGGMREKKTLLLYLSCVLPNYH